MACAEVAAAKAKTIAINLIILSSYANLQEAFLEARCSGDASRLWRKARVARRALQHSLYEPRPTKRKWVDVPTFSGANPVVAENRSVSSGDVARHLHPRRDGNFDRFGSHPEVCRPLRPFPLYPEDLPQTNGCKFGSSVPETDACTAAKIRWLSCRHPRRSSVTWTVSPMRVRTTTTDSPWSFEIVRSLGTSTKFR
jgi:hypothetical protein